MQEQFTPIIVKNLATRQEAYTRITKLEQLYYQCLENIKNTTDIQERKYHREIWNLHRKEYSFLNQQVKHYDQAQMIVKSGIQMHSRYERYYDDFNKQTGKTDFTFEQLKNMRNHMQFDIFWKRYMMCMKPEQVTINNVNYYYKRVEYYGNNEEEDQLFVQIGIPAFQYVIQQENQNIPIQFKYEGLNITMTSCCVFDNQSFRVEFMKNGIKYQFTICQCYDGDVDYFDKDDLVKVGFYIIKNNDFLIEYLIELIEQGKLERKYFNTVLNVLKKTQTHTIYTRKILFVTENHDFMLSYNAEDLQFSREVVLRDEKRTKVQTLPFVAFNRSYQHRFVLTSEYVRWKLKQEVDSIIEDTIKQLEKGQKV